MNDKFHNSIRKAGEEITLSNEERERMRHTLQAYMQMKPLRAPAHPVPLTFGWFFSMRPVAAVVVLALFISSAGISYAAEDALPGDLLYPVKTHVNEPIQGALAVSDSAKAAWAMSVAGERVKEAATLAAVGRLSTSTEQDLQVSFQEHAQVATESIALQASTSPEMGAETALQFEAQLSEYQNILGQIGTAKNIDTSSLTATVKTEGDHIATVRLQAESQISSASEEGHAAIGMQIAARKEFTTSADLAQTVSGSLSSSSAQLVAVQLDSASTTISAGEDFTAKHATPDALGAFQNALTATEKLGVFLQTSSDIHARTGLIVGEPQKDQTDKKTQRLNKNDQRANGAGGEPQPLVSTSTTDAASTTPKKFYQPIATTSTNEKAESETNTKIQTQTEEHQQTENQGPPIYPNVPTLPMSVPGFLSI